MQVSNINLQTNFKSKILPNAVLEQSFDSAIKNQDRFFVKAVNTLLYDGKSDILELKKRNNHNLSLYVNGEIEAEEQAFLNYYRNVGADLIKKYATKNEQASNSVGKYGILSNKERELVSSDVSFIKLLSENLESGSNYIENVQNILDKMKKKLDDNTTKEILQLKKLIFGQ